MVEAFPVDNLPNSNTLWQGQGDEGGAFLDVMRELYDIRNLLANL